MATTNDLKDAVAKGIISQEQYDTLNASTSALETEQAEEALDEAPRFIRSFGDFFIAIGTMFLGAGLWVATGFFEYSLVSALGALAIIWLAAEWLTGYLRISAPSIVLCVLFVGFSYSYGPAIFGEPGAVSIGGIFAKGNLTSGISALTAAILFYARFRLPFSIAIISACVLALALAILGLYAPDFLLNNFRVVVGAGGLISFIVAMWFDGQDPLRKSRLSDCGFWLHLIAAPMITHALLWDSHPAITSLKALVSTMEERNSWLIIGGLFLFFGIVALIINRRALLVSSLGYVGSVIAYGIWKLDLPSGAATSIILMSIAGLILTFGVGWRPLRRLVLSLLPAGKYLDKLPPAHA